MGVTHFPLSIYYDIEGEDIIVFAKLISDFGERHGIANFTAEDNAAAA